MKILVTGANGYLGKGIVQQLLNDGHVVVSACWPSSDGVDSRAIIFTEDIFKVQDPYDYFGHPDVVLHLAWRNGFIHNATSHLDDLPKHEEFLMALAKDGIGRIAVMGTMHEIGYHEGIIDDNTPAHPANPYGFAKNQLRLFTDKLCQTYNLKYQWLRGFYIVSNAEDGQSIFSKIAKVEGSQTRFPFTSGVNEYDFLDYEDFCRMTAAAVEQDQVSGIINICSGKPESLKSRVERFIQDNNYKIALDYGAYPDRPYDSKSVWGDASLINQIMHNREEK